MKVAVAGGTGVAGRWAVEALRAGGHEATVIARSAGVDLVTGNGLAAALAGIDAVIDATNVTSMGKRASTEFFEATARTLTRTAAGAGVRHIVALSIIGIDRVPYGYYQGKVRQEQVLRESPVPVSVLRAAQFHEFPCQYLAKLPGPVVIVPRWRAQPVAAREVGAALASIAAGEPVAMSELAGPREEIMADTVTLADEVGYAILVVMETLSPAERTAFVLHDLFGVTFDEVAAIVGRTPAAVRQLASRARRHVRGQSPWPSTDAAEHRRVVEAFAAAATSGDLTALIRVLDPDVILVSDGGGLVTSARKPVLGADHVARFLLGVLAKEQPGDVIDQVAVNGALGFAVYQQGELITVVSVTVAGGRVTRLDLVRAPGKLPRLTR
jgi:RNA polymerase sigma-70 factor, ECF subfamily